MWLLSDDGQLNLKSNDLLPLARPSQDAEKTLILAARAGAKATFRNSFYSGLTCCSTGCRRPRRKAARLSKRCWVAEAKVPDGSQPDQLSLAAIQELLG